jgi:hypothetical protein
MTQAQPQKADPQLQELCRINLHLDVLVDRQKRCEEQLQRIYRAAERLEKLLSGFTDEGSSFRAHQVDPLIVMYAALLGPILGDRIDASIAEKGESYTDQMTKGAAVMARNLLRTLDSYRQQREGLDYLENAAGDIHPPT